MGTNDCREDVKPADLPPWHGDHGGQGWNTAAYHVVCIYPTQKRVLMEYNVSILNRRLKQTRVAKEVDTLQNRLLLADNERFYNNFSSMHPEATGILLQKTGKLGENLYLLTAGHAIKGNLEDYSFLLYHFANRPGPLAVEEQEERNNWWKFTGKMRRKGIRGWTTEQGGDFRLTAAPNNWVISFGGTQTPDFALIKLNQKSSKYVRGYPMKDVLADVSPSFDKEVSYYIFPNGLGMKQAGHVLKFKSLGDIWKNGPYVFGECQVTKGCSGSPIFKKDSPEKLWGMVVSKGNTFRDFEYDVVKKRNRWKLRIDEGCNGTKILKIGAIYHRLKEMAEGKNWTDPQFAYKQKWIKDELLPLFELIPGISEITSPAEPNEDCQSQCNVFPKMGPLTGLNSLYFEGPRLISANCGGEIAYLTEDNVFTLQIINQAGERCWKLEAEPLDKFFDLNSNAGSPAKILRYPDTPSEDFIKSDDYYRISRWPWGNTQLGSKTPFKLRFVENIMAPDLHLYSPCDTFPQSTQTSALEGIGSIDWVDELPNEDCQYQQTFWICENHLIEFRLDPEDPNFIKFRTVDGLVDIHSWAFKKEDLIPETPERGKNLTSSFGVSVNPSSAEDSYGVDMSETAYNNYAEIVEQDGEIPGT